MKWNPLSRRMFLSGAGASLAIPLLTSLLPKAAQAQQAAAPRRFVSIITNYDMGHPAAWLPNTNSPVTNIAQPGRTFDPGNGHHPIRWQPLSEFVGSSTTPLSLVAGTHLNPYLASMTVMRSLNHSIRYGHGGAWVLGGITGENVLYDRGALPTIETMDVVLNRSRVFNPGALPLIFAGGHGYGPDAYSYTASGGAAANTPSIGVELSALYNRLFSNGGLPEQGAGTLAHPRFDVLSRVQEDYRRVRNSRNVSNADRQTLDNALDQLRDAQASLTRVTTAACSHSALVRTGRISRAASAADVGRALADLIAASMMCDSARTFTLGIEHLTGAFAGQADDHGSVSHEPLRDYAGRPSWQLSAERKTAVVRNFVAPLLQRLSAATDAGNGRSLLYNSLVYFTSESGIAHGFGSHPVMLFGNAGGSLSSGHYIDYADRPRGTFGGGDGFSATPGAANFGNNWWGASYNRLLVTILQAMGVTPAEYENHALNAQLCNRTNLGPRAMNLSNLGGFGFAVPRDLSTTPAWALTNDVLPALNGQDLRQFRNPLPFPV